MSSFKVRGVNFVIFRYDGKVLIQKRSSLAPLNPNMYCIPGGGVNLGESPGQAVIREIQEETGLSISWFNFMCGFEYKLNGEKKYNFVYIVKVQNPKIESNEGEMIWMSIAEIKKLKLPYNEKCLIPIIESYI